MRAHRDARDGFFANLTGNYERGNFVLRRSKTYAPALLFFARRVMWKIILCGGVIVVASTSVSGESATSAGAASQALLHESAADQEMRLASVGPSAMRASYDSGPCGANARRVQIDMRGSIDGGARCKLYSSEDD
jgi:hypothetical protein